MIKRKPPKLVYNATRDSFTIIQDDDAIELYIDDLFKLQRKADKLIEKAEREERILSAKDLL